MGELAVEVHRPPCSEILPAIQLAADMGKVLGVMGVIDQVCDGKLAPEKARSALQAAVAHHSPAFTPRFVLFAALGATALSVIETASLLLMALSAGLGALLRRWGRKGCWQSLRPASRRRLDRRRRCGCR